MVIWLGTQGQVWNLQALHKFPANPGLAIQPVDQYPQFDSGHLDTMAFVSFQPHKTRKIHTCSRISGRRANSVRVRSKSMLVSGVPHPGAAR